VISRKVIGWLLAGSAYTAAMGGAVWLVSDYFHARAVQEALQTRNAQTEALSKRVAVIERSAAADTKRRESAAAEVKNPHEKLDEDWRLFLNRLLP